MKKINVIHIFLILLLIPIYSFAGVEINNGGDFVYCENDANTNTFSGQYALDYLVEYRGSQQDNPLRQFASAEEYFLAFVQKLELVNPYMAESWKRFYENYLLSHIQQDLQRQWIHQEMELPILNDERLMAQLPKNCQKIIQAIVRKSNYIEKYKIEYYYNRYSFQQLKIERPRQFTFLLVHEWLWDFTDNVDTIRKFNWFLHSESFFSADRNQFRIAFGNLGLVHKMLPVCSRSTYIRHYIESYFQKRCDQILVEQLQQITSLNLGLLIDQLIPGDFNGFTNVEEMNFGQISNVIQKVPSFMLSSLPRLKTLIMNDLSLSTFPFHFFYLVLPPQLNTIQLKGNNWSLNEREKIRIQLEGMSSNPTSSLKIEFE